MAKHRKRVEQTWFVREWLDYKGLRQKDLVNRTEWNKSQVNEWVNEKSRWNRDVLYAFAHAIGVDAGDLLKPPPFNPIDDEFSRFAAKLDHAQKAKLLRLWAAVEPDSAQATPVKAA